jgi:hypothetical protein
MPLAFPTAIGSQRNEFNRELKGEVLLNGLEPRRLLTAIDLPDDVLHATVT